MRTIATASETQGRAGGWWGQRWLKYGFTQILGCQPEVSRLRSAGRAHTRVTFARGRVVAQVESGSHTYAATLRVKPWTERQWRQALDALGHEPGAAQALLVGSPGPEVEVVLQTAGLELFPAPHVQVPLTCTCRDSWACRHQNALFVHTATILDANPFYWLAVLGRDRAEVLAGLRARLAGTGAALTGVAVGEAGDFGGPLDFGRFWVTPDDPAAISIRAEGEGAAAPEALLRLLGPLSEVPPLAVLCEKVITRGEHSWRTLEPYERPVTEWLQDLARHVGGAAVDLARGERSPAYGQEPPTGKPLPLKPRLVGEVQQAIHAAAAPLHIRDLRAACPTAAALPQPEAEHALLGAVADLPDTALVLAGCYVGLRSTVLAGAVFRHVVTYAEWRAGDLSPDADWCRALVLAGHVPPFEVLTDGQRCQVLTGGQPGAQPGAHAAQSTPGDSERLFARLRPEVGDEIWLTVVDPEQPLLTAGLRKRSERAADELLCVDDEAIATLLSVMAAETEQGLHESDAVAVLLAQGYYQPGRTPDPVWLLPWRGYRQGLVREGRQRAVYRSPGSWRPGLRGHGFGHSSGYGYVPYWRNRENALRGFTLELANRGESRKRVEAAYACITLWCQAWSGEQDRPGGTAPLSILLNFLWNTAPAEARRHKVEPEWVPEFLAGWFARLGKQEPALAAAYTDHLAACQITDAYSQRLHALAAERAGGEAGLIAWQMEGYRWLGPESMFE